MYACLRDLLGTELCMLLACPQYKYISAFDFKDIFIYSTI